MEIKIDNILKAFPEATTHTQLLLESFHRTQLSISDIKPRNESMCKKCLTPWSSGQFTVQFQPSNHKRKQRRQHRIDKLQKLLKETDKRKGEIVKLKRKIEHLQKQNNHVAMYKCEICNTTTSAQCWKPKKVNKQGSDESSVTSGVRRKEEEQQRQKHEESTNKPKKNKGKKKKTAGLIIPPPKKTQQAPSVAHHQQSLSMAKLSDIFQLQQSQTMSKLNQFLK